MFDTVAKVLSFMGSSGMSRPLSHNRQPSNDSVGCDADCCQGFVGVWGQNIQQPTRFDGECNQGVKNWSLLFLATLSSRLS